MKQQQTTEDISLPASGWSPIALEDLGGADGPQFVDFLQRQLLPLDDALQRVQASRVEHPYSDPQFKNPVVYRDFLRRLRDSNLIDFSDGPCREIVAVFFVAKKLNRLRMIIDARRSNCHFADPHYVQLATGDSLGRLEFEPGSQLTICAADLKDAFSCHCRWAESRYLPEVKARSGRWVYPRLAVVPMGWSWALFVCQTLHERLV